MKSASNPVSAGYHNQIEEPVLSNNLPSDVGNRLGQLQLESDEFGELPASLRDLDLNREGYEAEALKLPVREFSAVIKSDELRCRSEDQVLDLTLQYIDQAQN